jgi:hypothetical protein
LAAAAATAGSANVDGWLGARPASAHGERKQKRNRDRETWRNNTTKPAHLQLDQWRLDAQSFTFNAARQR